MNLSKHHTITFFESAINNIIVNVAFAGLVFTLSPQDPGAYIIPSLLLINTIWFLLFMVLNYVKNDGALLVSAKAEALIIQLISFYLLISIFWIPGMNRRLYLIIYGIFSLSIFLLHCFGSSLKKMLLLFLHKKVKVQSTSNVIGRLKNYLDDGLYGENFQPSISGFENTNIHTLLYNPKGDNPQINSVLVSKSIQLNDLLENAEYTFSKVNPGDTIAVESLYFKKHSIKWRSSISLRKLCNGVLKRSFDIIVSLFVIIFFLSWMVPLIGLLIKLESKGPIFFKQLRSGYNNRSFWCYKFRSMHVNKNSDELQATKGDNRITAIGAFLRKTSIDEFPQFINVLKGEMSIVGPRPHMLLHTEFYGARVNNYMKRLTVRQGLTGWAQVKGYRGETSDIKFMEDRVSHDLWYMHNWSFWLDMKIIILTCLKIFKTQTNAF